MRQAADKDAAQTLVLARTTAEELLTKAQADHADAKDRAAQLLAEALTALHDLMQRAERIRTQHCRSGVTARDTADPAAAASARAGEVLRQPVRGRSRQRTPDACTTDTHENQCGHELPHRRVRPVLTPTSPPVTCRYSPHLSNSSVGNGPAPTRVV